MFNLCHNDRCYQGKVAVQLPIFFTFVYSGEIIWFNELETKYRNKI